MLDQVDVDIKRLCDGIADAPLAHAYPELLEHEAGEVAPFQGSGVCKEFPDQEELFALGPRSLSGRHPLKVAVDLDEIHLLDEERRLLFTGEEALDSKAGIAGRVDRFPDVLPLCADDVGDGVVEKVWTDTELLGTPVREDPAHDEANKYGEFLITESRQSSADLLDHIQASADPLQAFADLSKLQKLHTHILLEYWDAGGINPSVL